MARSILGGNTRSSPGAGTMSGAGGTLGGPAPAVGPRPGKKYMVMGDEVYLWILVAFELGAIGFFRSLFSRYHGG